MSAVAKRLLVIGGGIAGLSAAWRARSLSKTVDITLLEKESRLGGKILTERRDGYILEAGADGFLSRKPAGIELCTELGVAGQLRGQVLRRNRSFVMKEHRLHSLPEGFSGMVPANMEALKQTTLISDQAKRRAMEEPTIPARTDPGDESVSQFMTRRFGTEVFDTLIEPLLAGIYAGDASALSMRATFPHLRDLELRHGSVLAGLRPEQSPSPSSLSPFVTLPQGMAQLTDELSSRLTGVRVVAGVEAKTIRRRGGAWAVEAAGENIEADAVIIAVPSFSAARLLEGADARLGEELSSILFASTAIVHLAFRRRDVAHDLDGYGYVIPRRERSDLLACTWTSSKWEGRAPAGMALLRLYARRLASDKELEALARAELRQTMGITAEPVLVRVFRWPEAMPQYTLDHPSRLAEIEARCAGLEGLFLAGASYRGVGIPDCIESGARAARAAMERLE